MVSPHSKFKQLRHSLADLNRRLDRLEESFTTNPHQAIAFQESLINLGRQLLFPTKLESFFSTLLEEIRHQLQCDRSVIYQFQEDWSGEFIAESVASPWPPLLHYQKNHSKIKDNINRCSIKYLAEPSFIDTYFQASQGNLFSEHKPFRICEDVKDAGFSPCYLKAMKRLHARAYAIFPLYKQHKLWGLLAVYQNGEPREWQEFEINYLSQVALYININLQKSSLLEQCQSRASDLQNNLYQKIQERQHEIHQTVQKENALAEVIDKIRKSLDLEIVFQVAVTETRCFLDADRVGIFRFDSDNFYTEGCFIAEDVVSGFDSVLEEKVHDRCFSENYAPRYHEDNYVLSMNDVNHAPIEECHRQILQRFQVRANLVIPLLCERNLWGLFCIHQCHGPRQWEPQEIQFVQKIAAQLGVALRQARLLQKEKKYATDLEAALREVRLQKERQMLIAQQEKTVAHIIERVRQTLDLETTFQSTTQAILDMLSCDRVAVYRFLPDWGGEFVFESQTGEWTPLIVANIRTVWLDAHLQETQGGRYVNHEISVVNDVYQAGLASCHTELLDIFQIRAYVVVPIFAGAKLWGLLGAYHNRDCRQWHEWEAHLLQRVGDQLGVAVQQAELIQRLQEASDHAKAANHAKTEFLANMSHELRTPLNAILGFAQILGRDDSLNISQKDHIKTIRRSGKHLLDMLNDVLEMSKIEAGKIHLHEQCFDLFQLFDILESMFRLKAQSKQLRLKFIRREDVPRFILSDEGKLRQILINLLSNAIKFTKEGQVTLSVRADFGGIPPHQVNRQILLYFDVADTGPGIAAEELEDLFNPFIQTETGRQSSEGTGLGLAISKKFIQLMHGEISVQSKVNEGSCFSFYIRAQEPQDVVILEEKPLIRGLAPDQPQYRILVVDDNDDSRSALVYLLAGVGFHVQEATDGYKAIAMVEQYHPHLVWMDMAMPNLNGYEAVQVIRGLPQCDEIKIIALSASVFEHQREIMLSLGCDDFVSKPFVEHEIFDKIAQYLQVRYLYDESASAIVPTSPSSGMSLDHENLPEAILDEVNLLSENQKNDLIQAALSARENRLKSLIYQLPDRHRLLRDYLLRLTQNLSFETIIHIMESKTQ